MTNELLSDGFPFADGVLDGRTALVCGASKGIGRACALMLARAGARVVACARSADALDSLVAEMHGEGHEAVALDLEDVDAVREAVASLGTIHILLNNSGGPPGGPLLENTLEDFEGPFRRHLHAAHTITQALVPGMEEAGTGRIVNIISTSVREPIDNIGLSNTLRGAMASWAKSLSRELPPCVTINNIMPGFTDTDRLGSLAASISEHTGKPVEDVRDDWMSGVPIQRLIDPLETAAAVTWLCLPSSGAVRGISLAVDGGRMRSI
ncbi:MAG: short-chain dehydrogenase [Candidatus Thalassarchaeum betae]|uniref:Short-chain dehydrogenase n=1 Tax=Candidatus Thalassarchaeum betae TaxID=2599289 RepID=A0A2V3HRH9_9ARCH|nr:MAG: short-chain dehydrogenase [Candidatus Thalassoarchaea betae]PXF25200.1 MAG: short-chain dehydrogenase [Euryarchaeota archaeon]HIC50505.1 SDR family oxidoreductase [Candidatus Poseidoniales archaeon]HIM93106.1 SDR family oxidoreductase [Candidatus Poseidoniales archaeon]